MLESSARVGGLRGILFQSTIRTVYILKDRFKSLASLLRNHRMEQPDSNAKAMELNRLSWDERVEAHWRSKFYAKHLNKLREGEPCLNERIVNAVGDVAGKSLVHLQCHMGMETLSWAMLGADAVGLDFSAPAIEKAELLRDELGLETHFVCSNVYNAVEAIGQQFDIVFVSVGSICWLPDIERWGRVVGDLLRPGGRLYMNEAHPFMDVFEDAKDSAADSQSIEVKYPYLDAGGIEFECDGSYATPDEKFQHTRTVDHIHPVSTVINALIQSGLALDKFEEAARCVWPRFKAMANMGDGTWNFADQAMSKLPHTYTLTAHRN